MEERLAFRFPVTSSVLVSAWRFHACLFRGSNPGLGKVDQAFHPFSGLINEYQAFLGAKHWGSRQTDHLTRTSAHAPQGPWRREESPGWRELGKKGETMNAGSVGEPETLNVGGVGGLESKAQAYHHAPSLLLQSKGGSRSRQFVLFGSLAAVAEWYRYRIVAGFVTSSSPIPLKTRRVGQRCTLNLSRAETSSRWCGS
ncbi:histone-lysine N-methyltransferase SETMAR [Trichonephila clavipes]|nr:histone-lysine N-methyltransferase SETMAR [Trichonephila clavipes]